MNKWRMFDIDKKTNKQHIRELSKRVDMLETILTELTKELGYVITIEEFDTNYVALKKIEKEASDE
tara:strand:- start:261 stop:458 length:198 start_codon:yes stop_codon:yes gene_type:complete